MPTTHEVGCGGWFVPEIEDGSTVDRGYVHGRPNIFPRWTNVKLWQANMMATEVQEVSTVDQRYVNGECRVAYTRWSLGQHHGKPKRPGVQQTGDRCE